MYWDKASRTLIEKAGTRIEWSTEKPECFQLMRLVARWAVMSSFFRINLITTRRKYSDILWMSPRGM